MAKRNKAKDKEQKLADEAAERDASAYGRGILEGLTDVATKPTPATPRP